MPKCENTQCAKEGVSPSDIYEESSTGKLFCGRCIVAKQVVSIPVRQEPHIDYALSYTKKDGIKAGLFYGGASLTIEVSQEELNKALGLS